MQQGATVKLWASESGGRAYSNGRIAVMPEGVALIDKSLPGWHEFHVVPDAGHFAFSSPAATRRDWIDWPSIGNSTGKSSGSSGRSS